MIFDLRLLDNRQNFDEKLINKGGFDIILLLIL